MLDKNEGANQIMELLNSPEKLAEMKEQCKKLFIANSAENIFLLAQKICSKEKAIERN